MESSKISKISNITTNTKYHIINFSNVSGRIQNDIDYCFVYVKVYHQYKLENSIRFDSPKKKNIRLFVVILCMKGMWNEISNNTFIRPNNNCEFEYQTRLFRYTQWESNEIRRYEFNLKDIKCWFYSSFNISLKRKLNALFCVGRCNTKRWNSFQWIM